MSVGLPRWKVSPGLLFPTSPFHFIMPVPLLLNGVSGCWLCEGRCTDKGCPCCRGSFEHLVAAKAISRKTTIPLETIRNKAASSKFQVFLLKIRDKKQVWLFLLHILISLTHVITF